jgi:hypothetical protein
MPSSVRTVVAVKAAAAEEEEEEAAEVLLDEAPCLWETVEVSPAGAVSFAISTAPHPVLLYLRRVLGGTSPVGSVHDVSPEALFQKYSLPVLSSSRRIHPS